MPGCRERVLLVFIARVTQPPTLPAAQTDCVSPRDLEHALQLVQTVYLAGLRAFARGKGVDEQDLDDFVAEVSVLLVREWPTFDGKQFTDWLFAFAKFVARTRKTLRRRNRIILDSTVEIDSVHAPESRPGEGLDDQRAVAVVLAFLPSLKAIDRYVFLARASGQRAVVIAQGIRDEFGAVLTDHAVRVRWWRIRAKVQAQLKAQGLK